MLFDPQHNKKFRDPDPQGSQAMKAGVTAGADRNQPIRMVDARLPVVDMQPLDRAAGPALTAVAIQYPVAKAAEVMA